MMDIKLIAEEITTEQFVELIARVCVKDAKASLAETDDDEITNAPDALMEMACFSFYEGMHREPDVAQAIERVIEEAP